MTANNTALMATFCPNLVYTNNLLLKYAG